MADFFVAADEATAIAYIAKMDAALGYPIRGTAANPGGHTHTYARARRHEGNRTQYLVVIKPVAHHTHTPGTDPVTGEVIDVITTRPGTIADIDGASTAKEITDRKTEETLRGENAFPTDPDTRPTPGDSLGRG